MRAINLVIDGILILVASLFALAAIPPGLAAAVLFMSCRQTLNFTKGDRP